MRSYHNPDKFFSKMKKKPELQKVLDSLDLYTEDQLLALQGSQFPLWIREQLVELKKRNGKTADDMAAIIALKMIQASTKGQ